MYIGPIHPTLQGLSTGHSPVKPIKIQTSMGKQTILFDAEYPYALQTTVQSTQVDTVINEATQTVGLIRLHQIEELAKNAEWQRCGMHVTWREDGVQDAEDGFYTLKAADLSEEFVFGGYGEPRLDFDLRGLQRPQIGVNIDSKLEVNDAAFGGTTLAAWPMGINNANVFPAITSTFPGLNGNIIVVENPGINLRALFLTPIDTMAKGRCHVIDSTATGT